MHRAFAALLLGATLAAAGVRAEDETTLIGKSLPTLRIKPYMIQGERVVQDEFHGKVVWLELYQCGMTACERTAMPHLQALWDRVRCEPDGRVLVVNTSVEKDRYPLAANEENTRRHLQVRGWTMPVARDADEQTAKLLRRSAPAGAPMTLVIGPDGRVLAHEPPTDDAAIARLERIFTTALETLAFPPLRALNPALKDAVTAIGRRKFGPARKLAEAQGLTAPEDAADLVERIDDLARRRIERARRLYLFDPEAGVQAAVKLNVEFLGVPAADAFTRETNAWPYGNVMRSFVRQRDDLAQIDAELAQAGPGLTAAAAAPLIERLEAVARAGRDNRLCERAAAEAVALRVGFARPGVLGAVFASTSADAEGVAVALVLEGGPAAAAGLRAGDRLVRVGESRPAAPEQVLEVLAKTHPGDVVECEVKRDGATLRISVTLGRDAE